MSASGHLIPLLSKEGPGEVAAGPHVRIGRLALARFFLSPALLLASLVAAAAAQPPCPGDCDLNDAVTVAELVTSVNIALGTTSLSRCDAVDADDDGAVAIDELVGAVQSALTQCGRVTPTPVATPTTSATRTRTATRTPSPTPQLEGDDAVQASSDVALQTVESFDLLDFGFLDAGGGGSAAPRSGFRLAAGRRVAPGGEDGLGHAAGRLVGDLCPGGGSADRRCDVAAGTATLRVTFDGCRMSTASQNVVVRDGRVTVIVDNPDFCLTGVIADTAAVTLVFDAFRQVETDLSGAQLAVIAADLKDILAPTGVGCAGPEGRESIDGRLTVACSPRAQSLDCERGLADVTLRAEALVVQRASGGFPCTLALEVNGELNVDDRLDKETFTQTLRGFVLTESPGSNGATIITQDGDMSVDCLGALRFDTLTRPLTFPASSRCPVGGEIEVSRPLDVRSGVRANMASTLADGDGGSGGGTLLLPFRQRLFRAANGQVYQVLQNAGTDADKGADAIQITTLAGSLANAVDQCAAAAGPTIDPQAVTGAPPGQVLPLAAVFKSERIGDAGLPCFNGSSDGGDGRVCIGPDCANDCTCRTADCTTFGIGDGSKITAETRDVPRATLVPALDRVESPCSDFTGFATWRFGASGPTTQIAQCAPAPADGFLLPVAASEFRGGTRGTTIVFAYDTPLLSVFNAGAAGFPIDVNGSNPVGCQGPDRVLTLGRAVLDGIPGPRIIYNSNGGVGFDFDGDGRIDESNPSCRTGALAACQ